MPIKTNDPAKKSWIPVRDNSDFPIQNLFWHIMLGKSGTFGATESCLFRLQGICLERFCLNFSPSFCACFSCFAFSLVVAVVLLTYLYLFEVSTVEVGRDYFFYFCLLLSLEVLLVLGGCLLCAFSKRSRKSMVGKIPQPTSSLSIREKSRIKTRTPPLMPNETCRLLAVEEEDDY